MEPDLALEGVGWLSGLDKTIVYSSPHDWLFLMMVHWVLCILLLLALHLRLNWIGVWIELNWTGRVGEDLWLLLLLLSLLVEHVSGPAVSPFILAELDEQDGDDCYSNKKSIFPYFIVSFSLSPSFFLLLFSIFLIIHLIYIKSFLPSSPKNFSL